jgi:hypothetical protein
LRFFYDFATRAALKCVDIAGINDTDWVRQNAQRIVDELFFAVEPRHEIDRREKNPAIQVMPDLRALLEFL